MSEAWERRYRRTGTGECAPPPPEPPPTPAKRTIMTAWTKRKLLNALKFCAKLVLAMGFLWLASQAIKG